MTNDPQQASPNLGATKKRIAYLPGGGVTGGLYQLGVLAALEDATPDLHVNALDGYVGVGSGAVVGAALAAGLEIQRLYRALIDPSDPLFSLERKHIFRIDIEEWRWAATALAGVMRRIATSVTRRPVETAQDPWGEIDRFHDALPAGIFSLEHFERFLESFFERRGIPSTFRALPRPLHIPAHDIDTGETVLFGAGRNEGVRIARAICASMALPLFYAPVRIGERVYFAGSTNHAAALSTAVDVLGAETLLVVNPMIPVAATTGVRIPTGHGEGRGVRDKGMLWVYNQAMRIADHANLSAELALLKLRRPDVHVVLIEPRPTDAILFMYSPMNYSARRAILEDAYKSTRERVRTSTVSVMPPR